MFPTAGNTAQRTAADVELLDSLSDRDVIAFRNHIYSPAYIRAHADLFRDRDWVDASELRLFLREQMLESPLESAIRCSQASVPTKVKVEPRDLRVSPAVVKLESVDSAPRADPVRTRVLQEDGHDVLEILSSDSEPDDGPIDSEFEVSQALSRISSRSSSIPPAGIDPNDEDPSYDDSDDDNQPAAKPFHITGELQESDTIWQDPGITSLVIIGKFRITAKLTVERIEYVMPHGVIPSIWPNPRIPTAFILNLGSNYDAIDPKTGVMYTMDWLIKNHDPSFIHAENSVK
ncbi:hypothetical protein B0H10DRAFT_2225929 [Mycena sp. CBHHK59/15]|nr:hypothetical protein B0H10DRAFT_2225929 [Mycena sp. CBHHK59/15]